VRSGILERNWEYAKGRFKIAQIVVPRSRGKDVLTELHDGPSGGHLGVNKTLIKFGKDPTGYKQKQISRNGVGNATSVQPAAGHGQGIVAK
jgi:hypothetical protein